MGSVGDSAAPAFVRKPQLRQEDEGNRLIFECKLSGTFARVETKVDFWIFAKSEYLTKLREMSFHRNIGIPNTFV
jgi:hypothetical protein